MGSEGEGERMEQFVDFCEDAIFEMQISTSLSAGDDEVKKEKAALVLPGDDEPRGIIEPLPENISAGIAKFKTMTPLEKVLGLFTLMFYIVYGIGLATLWVNTKVGGTVLHLMRGKAKEEPTKTEEDTSTAKKAKPAEEVDIDPLAVVASQDPSSAFASSMGVSENLEQIAKEKAEKDELAAQVEAAMLAADEAKKKKAASTAGAAPSFDVGKCVKKLTSFLARNFFQIKFFALVIAFLINFMLLFYKVSQIESDEEGAEDDGMGDIAAELADDEPGDDAEGGEDGGGEDEEPEEYIHVEQEFWYLE